MTRLIINLENDLVAELFMTWMENEGQQNYWDYVAKKSVDSSDDEGEPVTIAGFEYDYDEHTIYTEIGEIESSSDLDEYDDNFQE